MNLSNRTIEHIQSFLNGEKGYHVYDVDGNEWSVADIRAAYMEVAAMSTRSAISTLSANNIDYDLYFQTLARTRTYH